jgi:glycosyltransferase involved in cell wall biosynthesis
MNVEALSEKMILLGNENSIRKKLGEEARKWVHENLIPEETAHQFTDILKSALRKGSMDFSNHPVGKNISYPK